MRHNSHLLAAVLVAGLSQIAPVNAVSLDAEQRLGQMLYMDPNLSLQRNQSCNSCHAVQPVSVAGATEMSSVAGFVDPDNVRNGSAVSKGSVAGKTGKLNAPSIGYASFSPHFHWDADEGLYVGGQFWNGRAATLAEQARCEMRKPVGIGAFRTGTHCQIVSNREGERAERCGTASGLGQFRRLSLLSIRSAS